MTRFLHYWDSPREFIAELLAVTCLFASIPALMVLLPMVTP